MGQENSNPSSTPKRSAPLVPISRTPIMNRPAPGPPLPRPVLPRERGYMDRVVEYLVGDGPHNRYALICKQCQSHNGMALREEFEYVAFRCAYCFYWNPARKQRPVAPRLQPMHLPASSSDAERSPKKTPADAKTEDEAGSNDEKEGE